MSSEVLATIGGAVVAALVFYGIYRLANPKKIYPDSDKLVNRPRDGGNDSLR